jgi:hypothetical protein
VIEPSPRGQKFERAEVGTDHSVAAGERVGWQRQVHYQQPEPVAVAEGVEDGLGAEAVVATVAQSVALENACDTSPSPRNRGFRAFRYWAFDRSVRMGKATCGRGTSPEGSPASSRSAENAASPPVWHHRAHPS